MVRPLRSLLLGALAIMTLRYYTLSAMIYGITAENAATDTNNSNTGTSCAIIYSSGSLLKHTDGHFIDTFDEVIRINEAPIVGHEDYVGNKTTVRVVHLYPIGGSPADWFAKQNYTSVRGLTFHMKHEEDIGSHKHLNILMNKTISNWTLVSLSYQRNCNRLVGYHGPHICTSGMLAVFWALENCDSVTVFGEDPDPCYPYHYWDPISINCAENETFTRSNTLHDFSAEHKFLRGMHHNGSVMVNRLVSE